MKTFDLVPGILSECFLRTLPALSSNLVAVNDLSNFDGAELNVTKLDVLQYFQYLRSSTKLDSNQIYNTVTNHLEKFGICGSRNCVKK